MSDNNLNDFGFSFDDDASQTTEAVKQSKLELEDQVNALKSDLEGSNKRLRDMYKKILVLLNNLKKNPDKPVINWPNRVEAIDKFIEELNKIKDNKDDK